MKKTSLYGILRTSRTQRFPNYWELLWGKKFSDRFIKTLVDVLPISFKSKGGNAVDWTIYGNAEGIGERTKNLYNPNATDVNNGYVNPGRLRVDGTINTATVSIDVWVTEYIGVESEHAYTIVDLIQTATYGVCYYDASKTYLSGEVYNVKDHKNKTVTTPANCKYIRFTVAEGYDTMLVEGNTAPATYIPYGYQVPITISQGGKTDKNYDIFIGDALLTEGESISKSSTGIDIEIFKGENIIDTSLTNKPEMSIKYY